MRRTVIVLIIATALFWCSSALCRRPPASRWDGDPDEYQATAVHEEKCVNTTDLPGRVGMRPRSWTVMLGRLVWEVLHPGTLRILNREGR